ncbi:hypothetical protein BABINDRAFT_159206 [Babjeviella inositovora NRRL Y-12698]|uniref:RGS domain-containing protein n=1 Tax=Babjeviella inositovora NRRL Y-12698 TaxID=984486 RepID=A0A1E3QYH8_9ASCO|nr:uncharacterized protein BABINDRAFT_159206 [Babjeviella inositovora NRRL Y-12698]ODQ82676.1 hypothetical protein BABINDRAFT_159206 [Babjeviella inositovora NRRL Y-12698]
MCHECRSHVPDLDELVQLCNYLYIENHPKEFPSSQHDHLTSTQRLYAERFIAYMTQVHCCENLQFLIDCFRYETMYQRYQDVVSGCVTTQVAPLPRPRNMHIHSHPLTSRLATPNMSPITNNNSSGNNSPSTSFDIALPKVLSGSTGNPYDTSSFLSPQHSRIPSGSTNNSELDIFEIEGVDPARPSYQASGLRCQYGTDNINISHASFDLTDALALKAQLFDFWHAIIDTYFTESSLCQLNVSAVTGNNLRDSTPQYRDQEPSSAADIPNPSHLEKVKQEVLALIRGNNYHPFRDSCHSQLESPIPLVSTVSSDSTGVSDSLDNPEMAKSYYETSVTPPLSSPLLESIKIPYPRLAEKESYATLKNSIDTSSPRTSQPNSNSSSFINLLEKVGYRGKLSPLQPSGDEQLLPLRATPRRYYSTFDKSDLSPTSTDDEHGDKLKSRFLKLWTRGSKR